MDSARDASERETYGEEQEERCGKNAYKYARCSARTGRLNLLFFVEALKKH